MALGMAGLAISAYSANKARKANEEGYENAQKAARFQPFNVRTGLGEASFYKDEGGGPKSLFTLSPEYQNIRSKYLGLSNSALDQALRYDMQSTTESALAQLRSLARPEESRTYSDLSSNLFSQGRLGAADAGGASPEMKAYFDSINQADMARQLQAIGLGNTQLDSLLNRGSGLFSILSGIDTAGLNQIQAGLQGGYAATPSAIAQAGYAAKQGQSEASFWNAIGQAALSYSGGGGGLFKSGTDGGGGWLYGNGGLFGNRSANYIPDNSTQSSEQVFANWGK